ncbi:transmembrane protein 182-like [Chiloscyllium plagiosum]|uniref:transmembrane protein 182-like n=1 Tax=Chiloscyllium plagiosum TaxID=36176 RepID=UPI001CB7E7C6|nr:transmembrane protein 182-like [Chiloscyllium plagiosum]
MNNLRVRLNCARLFAAGGLFLFFVTSCTNYWLHAVTYPSLNTSELEQPSYSNGTNQQNTNGERNSVGSNENYFTGNSTRTNQPLVLKHSSNSRKRFNKYRILAVKQPTLIYYHEGFFWKCWFTDQWTEDTILKFIFINQPPSKCCVHAYSSPFPSSNGETSIEFESALVYRQCWSAFMFLAVIVITIGSIVIIFKTFWNNHEKNKIVGGIMFLCGGLYIASIVMYVCWISAVYQMVNQDVTFLNVDETVVTYGWSFMAAPVGILLSLISGLLFCNLSGTASNRKDINVNSKFDW